MNNKQYADFRKSLAERYKGDEVSELAARGLLRALDPSVSPRLSQFTSELETGVLAAP